MPDSVIKTKVDDSEFWHYVEALEKHKETLEDLAGGWGKISASAKATIKTYNTGTAALLAQNELFHKETMELTKQQTAVKNLAEAEKKRAAFLKDAWTSTKQMASFIADSTKNLLKWTGIGTILSGLTGLGGLFGFTGLANRVLDTGRTAARLGAQTGPMQAFGLNYQRYVDTQSVMQNIATAKSNYAQQWAFKAMGVNPTGQDTAALSVGMVRRARDLYNQSDKSEQFAQAHGLLQFFSMDDLRALGQMTDKQLAAAEANYERDQKNLQISQDQNEAWANLSVTLKRAELTIFTVLVQELAPMAPQIAALSKSVIESIKTFASSDTLKKIIAEVSHGMGILANWIDSKNFQSDIKAFAEGIGQVAQGLIDFLKKIGWLKSTDQDKWKNEDFYGRKAEALKHLPPDKNIADWLPFGVRDKQAEAIARMAIPPWLQGDPTLAAAGANPQIGNQGMDLGGGGGGGGLGGGPAPGTGTGMGAGAYGGGAAGPWGPRQKANPALAEPMIQYFMKMGKWTRAQATAIVANLQAESGLSANPAGSNDQGRAYGLAQWHADRQQDFDDWARAHGEKELRQADIWEQARFVNYEMTEGKRGYVGKHLRNKTDLGDAVDVVSDEYEAPGDKMGARRSRRAIAVDLNVSVTTPPSASHTAAAHAVPGKVA